MNNLKIINEEISRLEEMPISYSVAEKLASLYIVKDHSTLSKTKNVPEIDGSDFLKTASGVDVYSLLLVLDEHMTAIKILYPKEYQALLKRIDDLK